MGNGLLAFAAGLGSGYLSAQQRTKEQARLDKLDAQAAELHNARMDDIKRVNSDRVALGEAGKLVTVNPEGATLGLADGTKTVYNDAGVANSDFRQLRQADQATGNQTLATTPIPAAPATPDQPASLADGTMPQAPQSAPVVDHKAYASLADANTAATSLNAPEAIVARQAAALNAMGQPEKAAALVAGSKQAKLADYQLSTAQTNHLNELANQKIQERSAANGGDWFKTQADILTETGVGGLAGAKAAPRPSADGKTMQIVLTRPDGTEQVVKQYANNDSGQMRAQQDLMQVNPTVKLQWLHERATTDQAQSNFDTTHGETARHNKATEDNTAEKTAMGLEIATVRLQAAKDRLANGGAPSREERLRYTNLFSDAGRRMAETQKTAATLSKSINEMTLNGKRPDTPAITETRQQLAGLQNDYNSYKEERSTYQALLAGSQGSGTPGLDKSKTPAPAVKPASAAAPTASPPANVLKENTVTTFANGQKWTLKNGKPTQVN